jgi:hypothetical protein
MTQMPSKLVEVVSALETLEFPYVLFREPSGAHRVLVEGTPEAAVLDALRKALGHDVLGEITVGSSWRDAIADDVASGKSASTIIIEVKQGSSKSAASMLWWMALQEGSNAARGLVHADTATLS